MRVDCDDLVVAKERVKKKDHAGGTKVRLKEEGYCGHIVGRGEGTIRPKNRATNSIVLEGRSDRMTPL